MKPRKAMNNRMNSELILFFGLVLGLVTKPMFVFAACPPLVAKRDGPCINNVTSWDIFLDYAEKEGGGEVVFCPFSITKNNDQKTAELLFRTHLICPSGECFIYGPDKHIEVRMPSTIQGFTFQNAVKTAVRFFPLTGESFVCDCTFKSNNAGNIRGGALRVASKVTVENSVFDDNQAKEGGAIYMRPNTFLTVSNSYFLSNGAKATTLVVNKNRFENNYLYGSGNKARGSAVYLAGSSDNFHTTDGNSGSGNVGCNGYYDSNRRKRNGNCIDFKGFVDPSNPPTIRSSETHSEHPSQAPSDVQFDSPTGTPTINPTTVPVPPTVSPKPSQQASNLPSNSPSDYPTGFPTDLLSAFAACPPLAEKIDGPCETVNSWNDFVELAESSETEVVFCPFNIETDNDDPAEVMSATTKKLICPSGECFIEGGGKHMEVRVPSTIQGFTFKGADETSVRFFNLNDDDESYYVCDSTFKS
eukprot:scaffold54734_cov47-Attheya_sp.AAC.2